MLGIILTVIYVLACLILIMFVLLQPGKSDAAAVFGGGANSAAFGPRGTQTVLAKITITAAVVFFLIAFLFSIPQLFEKRSLGEGAGPAEAPIAPVTPPATEPAPANTPAGTVPTTQPAAPAKPADQGADKPAKPAGSNSGAPAAANKK